MKYVVIRSVNQLSIVVCSRHKSAESAFKKAGDMNLKIAVYEMIDGDLPKAGEIVDRVGFYKRFRAV